MFSRKQEVCCYRSIHFRSSTLKNFLKKIFIFFPNKNCSEKFVIFSQKKAFLVFLKTEPGTFQPKLIKIKKSTQTKFLSLQETKILKKIHVFFSKESYSYVSENRDPPKIL